MTSSLPSRSLFSLTLILGTMLALSASQWLYVWIALEVNMLSFIPLMSSNSMNQETQASMKYFLAQSIGSSLLLMSAFMKLMFFSVNLSIINVLLTSALLIKLGAAPYHFWFPPIMSAISWPMCLILATWQKFAPLMLLMNNTANLTLLYLLAAMGSLTGGIGGINQSQLRPLMAYSSIGHLGWMMAASSMTTLIIYFTIYSFMVSSLFYLLWMFQTKSWSPNSSFLNLSQTNSLILMFMILSLAGLPPLTGFFPKFMIITSLSYNFSYMWPLLLIIGSSIQLFYYLSLSYAFIFKSISTSPNSNQNQATMYIPPLLSISAIGLLPIFTF